MSCPFFKEGYIGYCSASNFPYVPSIFELEQNCFKESFEHCANFCGPKVSRQINIQERAACQELSFP